MPGPDHRPRPCPSTRTDYCRAHASQFDTRERKIHPIPSAHKSRRPSRRAKTYQAQYLSHHIPAVRQHFAYQPPLNGKAADFFGVDDARELASNFREFPDKIKAKTWRRRRFKVTKTNAMKPKVKRIVQVERTQTRPTHESGAEIPLISHFSWSEDDRKVKKAKRPKKEMEAREDKHSFGWTLTATSTLITTTEAYSFRDNHHAILRSYKQSCYPGLQTQPNPSLHTSHQKRPIITLPYDLSHGFLQARLQGPYDTQGIILSPQSPRASRTHSRPATIVTSTRFCSSFQPIPSTLCILEAATIYFNFGQPTDPIRSTITSQICAWADDGLKPAGFSLTTAISLSFIAPTDYADTTFDSATTAIYSGLSSATTLVTYFLQVLHSKFADPAGFPGLNKSLFGRESTQTPQIPPLDTDSTPLKTKKSSTPPRESESCNIPTPLKKTSNINTIRCTRPPTTSPDPTPSKAERVLGQKIDPGEDLRAKEVEISTGERLFPCQPETPTMPIHTRRFSSSRLEHAQEHVSLRPQGVSPKRLQVQLKPHLYPPMLFPAPTGTTNAVDEDLIDFSTEKEVTVSIALSNTPSSPLSCSNNTLPPSEASHFQQGLNTAPLLHSQTYTTIWQMRQEATFPTISDADTVHGARFEASEDDIGAVNEEPVELAAEPVVWPAVLRMQEEEDEERRVIRRRGDDFVMVTPHCDDGQGMEREKKEKSPLVKKVGKIWGRMFGRNGKKE
ncbi:hypothetical protein FKW77_010906 [Venturia effusa]|uniref:Uncharacterized protein n=1 Tax=Venturia effusa TaxID=50376 RepID=A0A517KYS8_9PEZI|nr:hypothetical protein FKW77_010906 [Venturia effusa]